MKKIFKNMLPYWKSIILIVVVLVIQAYCDLALPTYTADIIDVGIQNKGIEHILPQEMTSEEYENAQLFMTKEEKTLWASSYEATQHKTYECSVTDKDTLDELDSEFSDVSDGRRPVQRNAGNTERAGRIRIRTDESGADRADAWHRTECIRKRS